jgi:hypothetical protein
MAHVCVLNHLPDRPRPQDNMMQPELAVERIKQYPGHVQAARKVKVQVPGKHFPQPFASASNNTPASEIDQLMQLHRQGLLSASDFARMASEISKTNAERLAEMQVQEDQDENAGSPAALSEISDDDAFMVGEDGELLQSDKGSANFDDEPEDSGLESEESEKESVSEEAPLSPPRVQRPFAPGSLVQHSTLGEVKIVRYGTASDFANAERIYVTFKRRKVGRGSKMEQCHHWVLPDALTAHEEQSSPPSCQTSARITGAAAEAARLAREQLRAQARADLPEAAPHERERKLPQKEAEGKRGRQKLERKTNRSKVSLDVRLQQFPEQSFVKEPIHLLDIVCRACKDVVFNKHR